MKLCLVNIVLVLLMTRYKEVVDGHKIEMSPDAWERDAGERSNYSIYCGQPLIKPWTHSGHFKAIVGGTQVTPGSWPWQLSIKSRFMKYHCGGSIIANDWIITAAHCIDYRKFAGDYKIRVGDHNEREIDKFEVTHKIKSIVLHEDYVCLPNKTKILVGGEEVYVTGWGETNGTGFDDVLKETKLPIVKFATCKEYQSKLGLDLTENMICAGYESGGTDACQGDSGGPLVFRDGKTWFLHGITSWGVGCAKEKQPGVYTKVINYLKWIESKISAK